MGSRWDTARLSHKAGPGPDQREREDQMSSKRERAGAQTVHQAEFLTEIPRIVRERPGRMGQSKYQDLYNQMRHLAQGNAVALKVLFESPTVAHRARSAVARYDKWAEYHSHPLCPGGRKWITAIEPLASNQPQGASWLYVWLEKDGGSDGQSA